MGDTTGGTSLACNQLGITFDTTKQLNNLVTGEKFLVISRKNHTDNDILTLNHVSPFLIKKVIDSTCCGEVALCKKLRNGTLLVKTKNVMQANKLIKLTSLSHSIEVVVTEHNTLNYSKGVIYSNDLRSINNEVILNELKDQKIVKVEKILKKNNDELTETGLIILTFASLTLPEAVLIGYEKIRVRPYIPRPLRCNNCYVYGHTSKFCKDPKICANCSHAQHTNAETNEPCMNIKACVNCKLQNYNNSNHAAFDKNCPVFLKEKEIQAIITLEKTNRFAAIKIYNERQPPSNQSYATTTRATASEPTQNSSFAKPTASQSVNKPINTQRPIIEYSNILQLNDVKAKNSTTSKPQITILPRGISKRTRQQLKRIASATGTNPTTTCTQSDSSEMDVLE